MIDQVLVHHLGGLGLAAQQLVGAKAEEEAVAPGRVVAHVLADEGVGGGELGRRGQQGGGKVQAQPLPVRPDVVVLGVEREDAGQEGRLAR